MDDAVKIRLVRQTNFSAYQIESYLSRCAGIDEAILIENIREAAMFGLDLDLLGR